jgi:osmotically-inducible protein OsmY
MQVNSDLRIQQDVIRELAWDSRVDAAGIGVTVEQGVVTLTGTVGSYARKIAAQEAAHRAPGVLDVANDIVVRIPGEMTRSDAEIAQALRRSLEWDALIPDERILSTVSNGWVTLDGTLDDLRQRGDAEGAARRLAGVRGVSNNIAVRGPRVETEQIRLMLQQVLERRAGREAERIHIAVRNGCVILAGQVRSWAEKRAILGAISHAPGVTDVKENLFVDPLF